MTEIADEIQKLHSLKEKGAITDDEFEAQKSKLLNQNPIAPSAKGSRRMTAAILAILLGGLGLHKFYLGSTLAGVFYLLLCWSFIPAIIALLEGIHYLTLSDEGFNRKYDKAHPNFEKNSGFRIV